MTQKENAMEMENKEEKAAETVDNEQDVTSSTHTEPETSDNLNEQPIDPEIDQLRKQVEEGKERLLRAQADFDNFRRRTLKEKEELAQYAAMKLIGELLPVTDNMDRALAASKANQDFESLAKGVDMIFRQFSQVLENEGLKPMNAVGQPFNPEFHQAIMQVESEEHEEGIVVEEVQKGYMLKEKVLRPAMVKVSM